MLKLLTRLLPFAATIAAAVFPMQSRAETITVTHWGSAFYGAPYAVAMEKGFFNKYGVDITGVLTSQGGGTSVRNTLAGDLPYGEVALSAAVEAINNGVPLRIIGSGVQSIADILWMAKKGSPLHSIRGSRRQEGRLHRARLGDQHADPDVAEEEGHRSQCREAGAGGRHRRQCLGGA